jgi:hypothetical protein
MIETRIPQPSASQIERDWRQLGFVGGPPQHIPPGMVGSDARSYRVMKCPACNHRGMAVKAFHRRDEYRLLCRCRSCGAGTELDPLDHPLTTGRPGSSPAGPVHFPVFLLLFTCIPETPRYPQPLNL